MITSVSPTNRPQQEGTVGESSVTAIGILRRQFRKCYDPQGDIDAEDCDKSDHPFGMFYRLD